MTEKIKNKIRGSMFGLAIGDALGGPVEFMKRDTFEPVTGMRSGGRLKMQAGEWTDDTSMALCLMESLTEKKGYDPQDQMERYAKWYQEGYLTAKGKMKGCGRSTRNAIKKYIKEHIKNVSDPYYGSHLITDSGNGSIMRLAPIPLFYSTVERYDNNNDHRREYTFMSDVSWFSKLSSQITHASMLCVPSCINLGLVIYGCVRGLSKDVILSNYFEPYYKIQREFDTADEYFPKEMDYIFNGGYKNKTRDDIKSTGFVLDTLESALWCFYNTDNFKDCVLLAVNLGDDADTVGAVAGQIAGAYYGYDSIPQEWIKTLMRTEMIDDMTNKFIDTIDGLNNKI